MDYITDHPWLIAVAIGGTAMYLNSHRVKKSLLRAGVWVADTIVEIKWWYAGDEEISEAVHEDNVQREKNSRYPVVEKHSTYVVYEVGGKRYIHFDDEAPQVDVGDLWYEPGIDSHVVFKGGQTTSPLSREQLHVISTCLGPYENITPKLSQLRQVIPDLDPEITKIIINVNDGLKEIVLQ